MGQTDTRTVDRQTDRPVLNAAFLLGEDNDMVMERRRRAVSLRYLNSLLLL